MSPDELILTIAERMQEKSTRWHIENYAATRSAAERLLRTMQIIPDEPPRQLPPSPLHEETMLIPKYDPNRQNPYTPGRAQLG